MSDTAPLDLNLAEAPDHGRAVWLKSGARRLRAAVWDGGARGTVFIFNGRSEYIEKYGRVIAQLTERGFSVATLDWQGQGLSDRPLPDRMKGHVSAFADYQQDVEAFLTAPEVAALPGKRVLMCHSMGGCSGMRGVLDGRVTPDATIMSAPMLGIHLSPAINSALRVMTFFADLLKFQAVYAPAPNKADAYVAVTEFEKNELTTDAEYYAWLGAHLKAKPEFGLGGPTLGWMARARDEMTAVARTAPPTGPMLMFLGSDETIVEPAAIRAFAGKTKTCQLVELETARHEVLMETPATQAQVWNSLDRFLADPDI